MKSVLLVILLIATPAAAQEPSPAWSSAKARDIADWTSTAMVGVSIGLDTLRSWRSPDRGFALRSQVFRDLATVGSIEVLKLVIHRERPNGYDNHSFPSMHTGLLVSSSGWKVQVSVPFGIGGGYLRAASAWHYPSDILGGAVLGATFMHFFPGVR